MKIFLAYDRENAANASYWEYYFKSCGIWAEKKSLKEKLKIPIGFKGVALVNSKKREKYAGEDISDYVYCMPDDDRLKNSNYYARVLNSPDVVRVGNRCVPLQTGADAVVRSKPGKLAEAKLRWVVPDDHQPFKTRVNVPSETGSDKMVWKGENKFILSQASKLKGSRREATVLTGVTHKQDPGYVFKAVRVQDNDAAPEKHYKDIIRTISEEDTENEVLTQLFQIYSKNQLWKACWFYEEFAKGDIRRWDTEIVQTCEKGLDSIQESIHERENEHIRYMEFYFRYILCGAGYRALSRRHEKCRELLEDFRPVLERYESNAMFQHLAGRICELSSVENKQAVFYYQKAAKQQSCSDFLYDLGHSFEKVYGDDKMALRFYREACELDSDNYKALYKLASGCEMQREWIEAYCLYSRIEKKLDALIEQNYHCGSVVSIQEIEYPYKACKRLGHICRQIFGWGDEEDGYAEKRSEITEKYLSAKSFRKLAALMREPGKGGEIAEEIRNKFTGKCYQ